jgi:hypothetical protein
MGVHLADNEYLNIEQFLQAVVGQVSGEGAVAHAHVGVLSWNDVAGGRFRLQPNRLVKERESARRTEGNNERQ